MKKAYIGEMIAICTAAVFGSFVGSLLVGILGVILAISNYPNVELERGAAIVGATFGSFISIPSGFIAGIMAGPLFFFRLVKRNSWHATIVTSASAFVIGGIISGVVLAPVGFFFFLLGHI